MRELFVFIVEKFGLPIALCLGMAWGIMQATIWVGEFIIKPTVDVHLDLVRDISRESEVQTKVLTEIKIQQEQHTKILEEILRRIQGSKWPRETISKP